MRKKILVLKRRSKPVLILPKPMQKLKQTCQKINVKDEAADTLFQILMIGLKDVNARSKPALYKLLKLSEKNSIRDRLLVLSRLL